MPAHTAEAAFRRLPLSCNRALVLDGLHFAREAELFPVERTFDLSNLADLRVRSRTRIAWSLLFLKAYSAVVRRQPILRRAYVRWPWPHLIEMPDIYGLLVVNRQYRGEDRICWARLDEPDQQSLKFLQSQLDRYKNQPVEDVFRRQVRLSKLPTPFRRFLLWWNLNFGGALRARRLGTFTLTTLAGQGTLNRAHQTFHTSSLTYGPLDDRGRSQVTLLVDHRVLDGMAAAGALEMLDRVLQTEIAAELRALAKFKAA